MAWTFLQTLVQVSKGLLWSDPGLATRLALELRLRLPPSLTRAPQPKIQSPPPLTQVFTLWTQSLQKVLTKKKQPWPTEPLIKI